jgi:hypothetical protein
LPESEVDGLLNRCGKVQAKVKVKVEGKEEVEVQTKEQAEVQAELWNELSDKVRHEQCAML